MLHKMRIMATLVAVSFSAYAFALFAPSASAQTPTQGAATASAQMPPQAKITPKRGALFKIVQGNHTLYLFGTIHVGSPAFYPLEPQLMQALAQSSALALELDPLANQEVVQASVLRYAMYPDGGNGNTDIPPQLRARLDKLLAASGMGYQAVAAFKPWMLTVILTMGQYAANGYQAALAVDSHLSNLAREQHKKIVELETIDTQLSLFGNMPMADQVRMLEESLNDIDSKQLSKQTDEVVNTWAKADAAGLEALARKLAEDQTFAGKFFQQELLGGRNAGLADGMVKLLKAENTSFAAIGVLHLVGKGSVPDLLKQRGLAVERIY